MLSRLAGDPNGSYGNTGDTGPGTSAKLSTIAGLALDPARATVLGERAAQTARERFDLTDYVRRVLAAYTSGD